MVIQLTGCKSDDVSSSMKELCSLFTDKFCRFNLGEDVCFHYVHFKSNRLLRECYSFFYPRFPITLLVKDPNGIKLFVEAFWAILGTLVIFMFCSAKYIVQYFFLTL